MRLALLLLLSALSLQAQAISKVAFAWTYSFTTNPACGSVTANCITSFVLTEGATVIATIPATAATSYTYNLTPLPAAGAHTYNLVAVELLTGTSTISSAPATVSLQVPQTPVVPGSFTATPQ